MNIDYRGKRVWGLAFVAFIFFIAGLVYHGVLWLQQQEKRDIELSLLRLRELKARVAINKIRVRWITEEILPGLVLGSLKDSFEMEEENPDLYDKAIDVASRNYLYTNQIACIDIPEPLPDSATSWQVKQYEKWKQDLVLEKKSARETIHDKGGVSKDPTYLGFNVYAPEECTTSDEALALYMENLTRSCREIYEDAEREMQHKYTMALKTQAEGGPKIMVGNISSLCGTEAYKNEVHKIRFVSLPPLREWKSVDIPAM